MIEIYEQNPERHIFRVTVANLSKVFQHILMQVNVNSEDAEESFHIDSLG